VGGVNLRHRIRPGNRRGAEARDRLETLLSCARRLFLERGYEGTSLNDVVLVAGGPKATVLKYFGNMAGLFSAVIADVSAAFVAAAHLEDLAGPPAQVLQALGERLLRFYLASDSLIVYRGVVAGGSRHRSMALPFFRGGHLTVVVALAARLAHWHRAGLVAGGDSRDDADLFLHLIRAGLYEQRLLGIRGAPAKREITACVDRAVHIFLWGVDAGK
jgi:AcrR family transcriptional regulator